MASYKFNKMSCLYPGCYGNVELMCKSCKSNNFLCKNHAFDHKSTAKHDFESISDELIKKNFILCLRKEIKKNIFLISRDSLQIINTIKKASTQAIKQLKINNMNIKSILEFRYLQFDTERIDGLVREASLLGAKMVTSKERPNQTPINTYEKNPVSSNMGKGNFEGWMCKCGESNMPEYDICIKCNDLRPGLAGWICYSCTVLNEENSYNCSICGIGKDVYNEIKQDYLICEQCSGPIINGVCSFCGLDQSSTRSQNSLENIRIFCFKCFCINSMDRAKCLNCNNSLTAETQEGVYENLVNQNQSNQNFWKCRKCNQLHPLKDSYCPKCLIEKPKNFKNNSKGNNQIQEWKCIDCGLRNSSNNKNCRTCGNNRREETKMPKS